MSFKPTAFIVVLVFSPVLCAQSLPDSQPLAREEDLMSAILSLKTGDERAASAILKAHKNLVTKRLFDALLTRATMSSATGDSPKSLFLCLIAKAAAEQLEDKRLLALALYR